MPTKNVRVDVNAEEIALKYGSSVSKGIMEMNLKLSNQTTQTAPIRNLSGDSSSVCYSTAGTTSEIDFMKTPLQLAKEKFSSTPVPTMDVPILFNEAYWKKMSETVQKSVEHMVVGRP